MSEPEPTELERAVARAICRSAGFDPDDLVEPDEVSGWEFHLPQARAAIAECFRWRPIEEAPFTEYEDGPCSDWFLLSVPDEHGAVAVVGSMDAGTWLERMSDRSCQDMDNPPTRYMPLPPPPDEP